jgi:hypothetical protein
VTNLPRLLVFLVSGLVAGARREEVLGDLTEGLTRRTERLGRSAARRWLWREVGALLFWRLRMRRRAVTGEAKENQEKVGMTMGRDLWQDVRFGVHMLARRPGFTAVSVLVLGLGIGAPATVLSLVNRAFFQRPPEVVEPHRLVRLFWAWGPGVGGSLGYPDFEYFRDNNRTLEGLMAFDPSVVVAAYAADAGSDQLRAQSVSDNYFDVLGVRPFVGRFFLPEEGVAPGERASVVLLRRGPAGRGQIPVDEWTHLHRGGGGAA